MPKDAIMPKQSLFISPEKTFELRVYVEQMASAFAEFQLVVPNQNVVKTLML
jgi:hypothetical protein